MQETREQIVNTTSTATSNPLEPTPIYENVPAAPGTVERVVQVTENRVGVRSYTLYRVRQAIWLILALSEILLAFRFILRLLGANPQAGFAQFIYGITGLLVAPFAGLFGTPQLEGSAFEFTTLVAMIVYTLLAWVIVKVMLVVFSETRSGLLSRWTDTPGV